MPRDKEDLERETNDGRLNLYDLMVLVHGPLSRRLGLIRGICDLRHEKSE